MTNQKKTPTVNAHDIMRRQSEKIQELSRKVAELEAELKLYKKSPKAEMPADVVLPPKSAAGRKRKAVLSEEEADAILAEEVNT